MDSLSNILKSISYTGCPMNRKTLIFFAHNSILNILLTDISHWFWYVVRKWNKYKISLLVQKNIFCSLGKGWGQMLLLISESQMVLFVWLINASNICLWGKHIFFLFIKGFVFCHFSPLGMSTWHWCKMKLQLDITHEYQLPSQQENSEKWRNPTHAILTKDSRSLYMYPSIYWIKIRNRKIFLKQPIIKKSHIDRDIFLCRYIHDMIYIIYAFAGLG